MFKMCTKYEVDLVKIRGTQLTTQKLQNKKGKIVKFR